MLWTFIFLILFNAISFPSLIKMGSLSSCLKKRNKNGEIESAINPNQSTCFELIAYLIVIKKN